MARFTELVLVALQFQTEGLLTIADMFLSAPIEMRKGLHNIPTYERYWFKKSWADLYRDRQQFYHTLNHLKRQGLVVSKSGKEGSRWVLTQRGQDRYKTHRQLRNDPFSISSSVFSKPEGAGITIVSYDIPEKERRKRTWIRTCLVEMGCERIQQSVWVAHGTIDEDFLHALRERDLLGSVHVFAVTKQGTIKLSPS